MRWWSSREHERGVARKCVDVQANCGTVYFLKTSPATNGSVYAFIQWQRVSNLYCFQVELVLCTVRLGSKAPARARLSRAPASRKSKPSHQWGLKLGSAQLKARAAAWVGDGEGDGKERHHNMGNRACCDVVPRRRHRVPWGHRE